MSDELEIAGVEIHDDNRVFALAIDLRNRADRTLHACATVRALRYDPAARVYGVQLSDRGLAEPFYMRKIIRPRFTSIDPGGHTLLPLTVPRSLVRVAPGENQIVPTLERLRAYEARYLDLEIAWGTTPFYPDPRKSSPGPRAALVAWSKGLARHRHDRGERANR